MITVVISFFAGILLGVLAYDTLKKVDELNKEQKEKLPMIDVTKFNITENGNVTKKKELNKEEKMKTLFDKRFVHFMWEDELEGKEGFFADDICELTNCVLSGVMHYAKVRKSLSPAFPFKDENGNDWLFFYYDPNKEEEE